MDGRDNVTRSHPIREGAVPARTKMQRIAWKIGAGAAMRAAFRRTPHGLLRLVDRLAWLSPVGKADVFPGQGKLGEDERVDLSRRRVNAGLAILRRAGFIQARRWFAGRPDAGGDRGSARTQTLIYRLVIPAAKYRDLMSDAALHENSVLNLHGNSVPTESYEGGSRDDRSSSQGSLEVRRNAGSPPTLSADPRDAGLLDNAAVSIHETYLQAAREGGDDEVFALSGRLRGGIYSLIRRVQRAHLEGDEDFLIVGASCTAASIDEVGAEVADVIATTTRAWDHCGWSKVPPLRVLIRPDDDFSTYRRAVLTWGSFDAVERQRRGEHLHLVE